MHSGGLKIMKKKTKTKRPGTVQDILRRARKDNDSGHSFECGVRIDEAIDALNALYFRMKTIAKL